MTTSGTDHSSQSMVVPMASVTTESHTDAQDLVSHLSLFTVTSRPRLYCHGSLVLLQPQTVLVSVAPAANKGHANTQGLCCHLGSCWHLRVKLRGHTNLSGLCCRPGPRLGPWVLLQLGSVLMSVENVSTKDHTQMLEV